MRKRWRVAAGLALFAVLAGCAGHFMAQREPWRKDAEIACLKSGSIRESVTIVRAEPINGPGMCGADFPFKVAALGDNAMLGYSGEMRPPGEVPNSGPKRWPVANDSFEPAPPPARNDPRYAPPPPQPLSNERQFSNPARKKSGSETPVQRQPVEPPYGARNAAAPMPIAPQGSGYNRQPIEPRNDPFAVNNGSRAAGDSRQGGYVRAAPAAPRRPSVYDAPPVDDDDMDESSQNFRRAPSQRQRVQDEMPPVRSGPSRAPVSVPLGRSAIAAVGPVEIKPPATLACPIVSALDRWITDAVQPSAQRWFRQPVTEIKQISAYSCRGMNGQPGARISEHAFGNALDIASFTLADGRKITVKNGWRGSPEEQGFLRDVQGAACDSFNTVLAPGSNRFHYDHIHVDLMRRSSGHKICNPDQIPGEVVAARAAKERGYALRPEPGVTGSIGKARTASLNGKSGKAKSKSKMRNILDDEDWIEDEGPRAEE
ncbi:MAG: extensin family protein [Pseudorhodoplanes sp.]